MRDEFSGNELRITTSPAVCGALRDELDAALEQSASLAWRTAGASCYRDPESGETCLDYHRTWQYLLLLGIRNSTHPDTPFLLDTFRALARRGQRRILVSGSADYAMLAHVLRACELEDVEPDVTVLDRCATPLALNRWYAARVGIPIATIQSDAISFVATEPFDIVCTHSFVGWFSPQDRRRLLAAWSGNLRSGGHVITTRRIREATHSEGRHAYDGEELQRFEETVRRAAQARHDRLDVDVDVLVQAAMNDARARVRYTTTSARELVALFEGSGLEVVVADTGEVTPGTDDLPSGPVRGAGNRVRIVARRKAGA